MRRIHGALVYQLYNLKKFFYQEQEKEIINYVHILHDIREEAIASQELESSEEIDDFDNFISNEIDRFRDELPEFRALAKPVNTRWFSDHRLIKTILNNEGIFFFIKMKKLSQYNFSRFSDSINMLLPRVRKTDIMLIPEEVELLKHFEKLYEVFELAVNEFQSGDLITSHLAVAFFDNIQTKLYYLGQDSEFLLREAALRLRDFARTRLDLNDEYLASAVLHPQQCESSFLLNYLSGKGMSREGTLVDLCEKYEIDSIETFIVETSK